MKNSLIAVVGMSLALSGCFGLGKEKPVVQIQYKVVKPESTYYTCEQVKLPDPATLTDAQVAQLINDLVKANRTCKNNMNAIKQYLDAAEEVLEKRQAT